MKERQLCVYGTCDNVIIVSLICCIQKYITFLDNILLSTVNKMKQICTDVLLTSVYNKVLTMS